MNEMTGRNYSDLLVWQKAINLVEAIYKASESWPSREMYGLTSQIRRAAVSIPSNIAEGQGRRTSGDFYRFLNIAHGSIREVETQLIIANRLGYLESGAVSALLEQASEVGRLLTGLQNSLQLSTSVSARHAK